MNVRDEGDILERESLGFRAKWERERERERHRLGKREKRESEENALKSDMSSVYKEIKGWDLIT